MIIDANELRALADECVAAAAKCSDPDAAAKLHQKGHRRNADVPQPIH
jgi:hypothetical protein